MKKIIELVCMAVILTVCANGCIARETNKNNGVKEPEVVETEKVLSPESAVDIYMENKDLWMENPEYYPMQGYGYCLLDLDFDGVLELINSLNDGSGRYSSNKYFKINTETLEVEQIVVDSDENMGWDDYDYLYAAHDATKLLRNNADNIMFYYCTNHTRVTTGEGSSVYGKLILNEGKIGEEIIFSEYYCDAGIYDNKEDIRSFTYMSNGESISVTEAEYNEKTAEFFKENTDLNLQWVCIEGREFDNAGIKAKKQMLLDAYRGFSYDGFSFDAFETYDNKPKKE